MRWLCCLLTFVCSGYRVTKNDAVDILERQAEGIAVAKAEGRMNGRPKKAVDTFEDVYRDYEDKKISASEGARRLGIARSTWYRKVKEYEADVIPGF